MSEKPIFICSLMAPYGEPRLGLFDENQPVRILISNAPDDQDPGACGFREAVKLLHDNNIPYKHKQSIGGFCIELSGTKQSISSEIDKILPTTMWSVLIDCLHSKEGAIHFHNAFEPANVQQAREQCTLIDEYADTERDVMSL